MERSRSSVLKYFKYDHLPDHLQAISKPFADMADEIVDRFLRLESGGTNPDPAETAVGLRKLLEAKDCIVRSVLSFPDPDRTSSEE